MTRYRPDQHPFPKKGRFKTLGGRYQVATTYWNFAPKVMP